VYPTPVILHYALALSAVCRAIRGRAPAYEAGIELAAAQPHARAERSGFIELIQRGTLRELLHS